MITSRTRPWSQQSVDAWQREGVLRTSLIDICVVNTQPPLPICLAHYHWIGQPRWMEHSSYQTRCFQFPDLLCDELLSFQSLLPDLLLNGSCMRAGSKMVLNHFTGNAGDVGCLPCKHVDIRPQEGDERAFLFAVKGGAYGKSSSRAVLLDRNLLGSRRCGPRLLVSIGGALWHVLDGSATLRRGALAGVGA